LDRLPPTITDHDLLALLGSILENDPTPQSTGELRLRFFQPGFSWQALVDLAVAHEVLPPLILTLRQRALLLPLPATLSEEARAAHVTSRLAAAYLQHLDRQADLREQLKTATGALNNKGIVPTLLKGAVHLTRTQPEWHEARGMRDLDILVRTSEAENAYQALVSLGYRPDDDPPPIDRHLPELRLPRRAGAMEIHTEALSFSARHALATEEIFERAEIQSFDGVELKILPPEWHLLHNLLHHQLADRGHARRMLAIKGLWEFSRVGSEVSSAGWHTIIEHASQRKFLEVLSSWAIQANHLFGLKAPNGLMSLEAGRRHAEATIRQARKSYLLRQGAFVADKLRFAFAPETLALRYRLSGSTRHAALRHVGFLLRRQGQRVTRFISFEDVHEVLRLASLGLLAWTLPEFLWWPISRLLGRLNVTMHPARTRNETAQIANLLSGANAASDPYRIDVANWANRYEEKLQYLRAWRPYGWNPRIDVLGAAHVSNALDKGHGIVFWGGNFSFNNLLAMIAMHRLGLAVRRFSVPQHGFSNTPFGVRYLNRVCRDIENRYLGERFMVQPHEMSVALQHLRDCLKANGAVYFAVGGRGRRTANAKFLDGSIILPTGPLAMAHATAAAMLPVYTLRVAPARFEVTFGAPINFPGSSVGNVDYTAAVQAYADTLIPFVLRDPGQWCGWHLIKSWTPW
jgi:lauroyl/myristoyl acyltransferase